MLHYSWQTTDVRLYPDGDRIDSGAEYSTHLILVIIQFIYFDWMHPQAARLPELSIMCQSIPGAPAGETQAGQSSSAPPSSRRST
jgi:hypothetical protein